MKIQWITADQQLPPTFAESGTNLLDLLRQQKIPTNLIEAPCGGNGTCGKCRVQIVQGEAPVTEEDRSALTEQELRFGFRLACRVKAAGDLAVRIGSQMSETVAADAKAFGEVSTDVCIQGNTSKNVRECYIAVDLGSTTLAAALIDEDGTMLAQVSAANSQRAYGADVISRIQASNAGRREELRACICTDLTQLFQTLLKDREDIRVLRIAIAGNTVMLHLLRGYSCERLGQAPFLPVNLKLECLDYAELFPDFPEVEQCRGSRVYLLPGLSAFVGADITAGLYSSGFLRTPDTRLALFLDLGTNGEMAAGNRSGFITASVAAGPAFEGGRLSCGVPGIPGAISKVNYLYHRIRVQTIGQKKPCGICGTGALDAAAALLKEGLLDVSGRLAPKLFDTGLILSEREDGSKIRLTQGDIREIQMAKAAVRAGIEVLLLRYREMYPKMNEKSASNEVDGIYLAGGLGCYLSSDTAAAIGLIPAEWKDKIVVCGNTSLKGAAAFLTDRSCPAELAGLSDRHQEIQLAEDPYFQDMYVREMQFPCTIDGGKGNETINHQTRGSGL